jgi:P27 family predicted phage terminase small subunit
MSAREHAPRHLSPEARKLWRSVNDAYDLEDRHRVILTAACEAHDRMKAAGEILDKTGLLVIGRFGPKSNPAIAIERDSRLAMLRSLRELGLDLDDPAVPRPPTRWRPS